jgi:arginine-tRNA-protein transferase
MTGAVAKAPAAPRLSQIFYATQLMPCPYLQGRLERKVVTEIAGPDLAKRYGLLTRAGFRRSHVFAYRPACPACEACVAVRIRVADFAPSRSQRRVRNRNRDVIARPRPPRASSDHYELFHRYLQARHGDGEMADMSFEDYRRMVEETKADTRLVEFLDGEGRLLGVLLADWLDDGLSAIYSFFDSRQAPHRSLGAFMILWLVEAARGSGCDFVYLGYWIADAPKMAYKIGYQPLEGLIAGRWMPLPASRRAPATAP